jgi:hypothetical protein
VPTVTELGGSRESRGDARRAAEAEHKMLVERLTQPSNEEAMKPAPAIDFYLESRDVV